MQITMTVTLDVKKLDHGEPERDAARAAAERAVRKGVAMYGCRPAPQDSRLVIAADEVR